MTKKNSKDNTQSLYIDTQKSLLGYVLISLICFCVFLCPTTIHHCIYISVITYIHFSGPCNVQGSGQNKHLQQAS